MSARSQAEQVHARIPPRWVSHGQNRQCIIVTTSKDNHSWWMLKKLGNQLRCGRCASSDSLRGPWRETSNQRGRPGMFAGQGNRRVSDESATRCREGAEYRSTKEHAHPHPHPHPPSHRGSHGGPTSRTINKTKRRRWKCWDAGKLGSWEAGRNRGHPRAPV